MLRVEDYEPELWMQQENFEPVPDFRCHLSYPHQPFISCKEYA